MQSFNAQHFGFHMVRMLDAIFYDEPEIAYWHARHAAHWARQAGW